jgi:hypothetical protein
MSPDLETTTAIGTLRKATSVQAVSNGEVGHGSMPEW